MHGSASADTRTSINASKRVTVIGFGRRLIANLIDAVLFSLSLFLSLLWLDLRACCLKC
jgi:hypothetical protein